LTKLGRSDLIPVLKPSYEFGCKRLIFSSDYFEAIASPNVTVVRSPIKEIKGNKIITEDGQIEEVDILVLGTGYKTQEGFLGDIESKIRLLYTPFIIY
jgi:cation diffusion facilitator CzcD-associated flavoprotein CzcO